MNDIIQSQGLALNQGSQYQQAMVPEYQQGELARMTPMSAESADMSGIVDLAELAAEKRRQREMETGMTKSAGLTPNMAKNSGADASKLTPQTDAMMSGNGMANMVGSLGIGKPAAQASPIQSAVSGGMPAAGGGGAWSKLSSLVGKL